MTLKIISAIKRSISSCSGNGDHMENGWAFICPLDPSRSLYYLHTFFPPVDADRAGRPDLFRNDIYREFMSWSGGANLFGGGMFIYGHPKQITRSIEFKDQQPLSIELEDFSFSVYWESYYREGWRPVGSVLGNSHNHKLLIREKGDALLLSETVKKHFTDLDEMLTRVFELYSAFLGCKGVDSDNIDQLEALLLDL